MRCESYKSKGSLKRSKVKLTTFMIIFNKLIKHKASINHNCHSNPFPKFVHLFVQLITVVRFVYFHSFNMIFSMTGKNSVKKLEKKSVNIKTMTFRPGILRKSYTNYVLYAKIL